jgi:YidC/Oxa1 family membrane protein insertase
MERRVFVAILLSFVVLYGYQALFVPPAPQRAPEGTAATSTLSQNANADPRPPEEPTAALIVGDEPAPVDAEAREREIVVETTSVQAVFSNRGARLLHWRLKSYGDTGGRTVDLVPSDVPVEQPRPFSLTVEDPSLTRRLNTALYRVKGDTDGRVDATGGPASLAFEFEDASGLRVSKEFRFEPTNYVVTFSATVTQGDQALTPAVAWGPGLGDSGALAAGGSFFTGNYTQPPEAIYHRDGEVERLLADALREQPSHEGTFRFAGVDDHYFIAAAVNPGQARLEFQPVTLPSAGEAERLLVAHSLRLSGPPNNVRFFIGPKQFDALQSVDQELVRAINFGVFGFLSVPLLNALKWVHGFVGNWGWSIIVLTVLINLAIAPLRHKSVVSMRKMQALQPQLKAIQDHYAGLKVTDPARQKMNTEIMNLYREKGVNPASGCVPMLLTLPILFAFYSLLSQAIELRGAEFGLWITDLSEHDPYYVTPVLMAITMFWQQWITPSTADPAQQKIMMMMPVMFGVMFLWVPSGLVLYWFVGNLWAIGQQYFTNWLIGPPVVAAVRSPAERRIKNAGAGRTAAAERKS